MGGGTIRAAYNLASQSQAKELLGEAYGFTEAQLANWWPRCATFVNEQPVHHFTVWRTKCSSVPPFWLP